MEQAQKIHPENAEQRDLHCKLIEYVSILEMLAKELDGCVNTSRRES